MCNNKPNYAGKTIKGIFRAALIILLNIGFISLYFSNLVLAEGDIGAIVLKDLKAELSSDDLVLKLYLDNQAANYIQGTPVVEIYKKDQLITNKASSDYILLPNNTNIITIYYSASFFDEGEYTIRSKILYDQKESNTLLKALSLTSDGKISLADAREVIIPSSDPLKNDFLESNISVIILILICLIFLLLFIRYHRFPIQNADSVEVNHPKTESEKLYGTVIDSGALSPKEPSSNPQSYSEEASAQKEEPSVIEGNIAKEGYHKKDNLGMQKIIGRDVIHAVDEEKERLKEEITDLEKLRDKDILDLDIYEKNKKMIEDRLEHLSIDSLVSTGMSTNELGSGLTEKLKHRKDKIIETIDLMEKLYTRNIIDEETFIKNKNELKSSLDKLKYLDSP